MIRLPLTASEADVLERALHELAQRFVQGRPGDAVEVAFARLEVAALAEALRLRVQAHALRDRGLPLSDADRGALEPQGAY